MAMLSLLLDGSEDAWCVPELHALRGRHDFVGKEEAAAAPLSHDRAREHRAGDLPPLHLGTCETSTRRRPIPGVFADEKLFSDARTLLDELGDDAFFAPMNADCGAARASKPSGVTLGA
jgi:hypothetical protein